MLPSFDRNRLIIKPLGERKHDLSIEQQLPLEELPTRLEERVMADIEELGRRMAAAKVRRDPSPARWRMPLRKHATH